MRVSVQMEVKDEQELTDIVQEIKKIQKEHSGDCVLSVYIPANEDTMTIPPLGKRFFEDFEKENAELKRLLGERRKEDNWYPEDSVNGRMDISNQKKYCCSCNSTDLE